MSTITLDRFELGIDLRKGDSVADANRLRDLRNAYVNSGWAIQKRPGSRREAWLSQGSVGMLSFDGFMHTFSSTSSPTHGDGETLKFKNHVVLNPDDVSAEVCCIQYNGIFNGVIYVAVHYKDDSTKHHYLIDRDDWTAGEVIELGDVRSSVAGGQPGIYYEAIQAGTTGGTEPTWPTVSVAPPTWVADTVYDAGAQVTPIDGEDYYTTIAGGTSGATEPTWPGSGSVVDNTVTWDYAGATSVITDGGVKWKPITTAIADANCPHSESCIILGSKIYAVDGDIVRFTATDDPTDWTTASDAGFLPTGTRAPGSPEALSLGDFQGDLVVFMEDAIQVWAIDPDPQRDSLRQIIGNVGTHYPTSVNKVGDDLYFLSDVGFRSIAQQKYTTNLEDIDVGTPIDPLIKPIIKDIPHLAISSIYYAGGGQYLCAIGSRIYVYSFSRTSKVSAWSYYDLPVEVSNMALQGAQMYFRAGDDVFHADENYYTDDGQLFEVSGLMAFQSFKKPGVMKHIWGCDVVIDGECEIRHLFDARHLDEATMWLRTEGDTRPAPLLPVEVMTTEVAFQFKSSTDADFRLDSVAYHYYKLDSI